MARRVNVITLINFIVLINVYFTNGLGFGTLGNKYLIKELLSSINQAEAPPIETKWMEQPLDHFDSSESRTYKMRYFERLDQWKANGPVYLLIYGEGEAHPVLLQTGLFYQLATETNGAMYGAEHRYYGQSKPSNWSSVHNLKYLSSRQALADIANLLKNVKSQPQFETSKVVVVGGSYSGNLAAWMKLLYPDLVDAAIASSAPVLAQKNFFEYLEVVSNDYTKFGQADCINKIESIFKRYEDLLKTTNGIEQLKKEENICDSSDMSILLNQQLFISSKADKFMNNSQYGSPSIIEQHCEEIINTLRVTVPTEPDDFTFWTHEKDCYNYDFKDMINHIKQTDSILSWTYQTCTEFGYFQSTTSNNQPFTNIVTMDYYYKICKDLFGIEFDENRIDRGVKETNKLYGGKRPNVTNVVFVNGDMDPWHILSVLEDISYNAPAKIIPRSSHCKDLMPNRKDDSEEIIEARIYIKKMIKQWIGAGQLNEPQVFLN